MVLIQNYGLAIFFCVIACICWGSWANTQKIAVKTWRFELFYFDMVIGIVLVCALAAFTLGSFGSDGRSFMTDLETADFKSIGFAMIGGTLWNLGTLFFFSIGVLVSTFMFNPIFMAKPVEGKPVTMRMYFKGTMKEHLSGVLEE